MNCTEVKKQIDEFLDGGGAKSLFAEHLESCAECRAYYERMLLQQRLLRSLAPKNAPQFDLSAAKRRKRIRTSRIIRWSAAAAAVFAAVFITGSLGLFRVPPPKSSAALSDVEVEDCTDELMEEAAVADEFPAESDLGSNDDALLFDVAEDIAQGACLTVSVTADEFEALFSALEQHGLISEPAEEGVYIYPDTEEAYKILSELLSPYTGEDLTAYSVFLMKKE